MNRIESTKWHSNNVISRIRGYYSYRVIKNKDVELNENGSYAINKFTIERREWCGQDEWQTISIEDIDKEDLQYFVLELGKFISYYENSRNMIEEHIDKCSKILNVDRNEIGFNLIQEKLKEVIK